MKSLSLSPDAVTTRRLIGKRLPSERFGVVRVRGDVACDNGFYWVFDNLDDAKQLCAFLVTDELGAYVFDTVIQKKVFELAAPPE
ncbi:MAG TPA: hypothetical protein VFL79_10310 [Terriglobia bacterium]|nr:hypothetical protein [Terriglobia bacterium]